MHVIHCIRIETKTGGGTLGRKVDRAVAGMMMDRLSKRLDECFDRVSGDRSLRIEKMKIDLGELSWEEFERGFVERVAAAVMAKILPDAVSPDMEAVKEGEPQRDGELLEAWVFFLRHGHLPWWFADSRWDAISSVRKLHEAEPERVMAELEKLMESPAALVRLARHATAEELLMVLGEKDRVGELGKLMGSVGAAQVIASWLRGVVGGAEALVRMVPLLSSAERAAVGVPETPVGHVDNISPIDPMRPMRPIDPASALSSPLTDLQEGLLATDAGLPVGRAGLVLLHPFLGRLFRQLEWLDEAGGLNPDFRWHAVQALQFLALGRCGLPEATQVFEKTICGMSLHEVAEFPALDDEARAECEGLLEAVIGHWSVLGNTSAGGLRESFLARPGLLFFEEERVRLAVERRPFDMLLGKLPWPLGPVMFGWLKQPIFVKWEGGEA